MDEPIEQDLPLSRTKLKKLAKEVEALAKRLAELSDSVFRRLELEDAIRKEIVLARETLGRGSHKRQIKHLAGLLRQMPGEVERLRDALEAQDQVALGDRRQFHHLEELRDRLCDPDRFPAALDEVLELYPNIDRNTISRLSRSVHQHADRRAARELFRRLRDELTE
ncbi:MAG TPA: ribosome biogenesis factor YjgA [Geopsychrobacteraceae bacterium]